MNINNGNSFVLLVVLNCGTTRNESIMNHRYKVAVQMSIKFSVHFKEPL